ncbi:CoA-binding protein [Robiginitalea sp. SC105]|uniref:CoA-binding protein n=1 Tax=Robiginitalea sp. SC105 TaxID=2762332 RepID=UPI00163A9B54|nr:CoA-binding protein [Robiginitalea sp. SC105]
MDNSKKTLVFGASLKRNRYSNLAMKRLAEAGVDTVAFGLVEGRDHGIEITRNLSDFQGIHTITLYMNPRRQEPFYQAIVDLAPKRVIFNPGTENREFYNLLKKKGIQAEEACTLVMLSMGTY